MIYVTSDTHFFHSAIIQYCNRPFVSVEEMNEKLIANWNSVVTPSDTVYHMGDFSWGNVEKMKQIFNRLNGQKHLISGNHDDIDNHKKLGWGWIKPGYQLKVNDTYYQLYHYPQRSWDKSCHSARHLFGHCHGTLKPWGFSFDVGSDCWDYTPISLIQVEDMISKLPRINPEFSVSFMPTGQKWRGLSHISSCQESLVRDESLTKSIQAP